jgi:hypothetical protein
MRKHLALVLFLTSTLFAQSRFDGTWQMKMETLQFSGPPEDYLFDKGKYHCESCVPKVDVKMDGSDQKVTGHAYDTLAVRILDDHSIKFTMKKDGKTTFGCTETVSPDDRTMTEEFTNTMEAETVTGKAGFTRVGKGPPGSHALSGKWRMDAVKNATKAGTLTTYQSTTNGMKITDGSRSYEAPLDGQDHPRNGDVYSTVSLKLIDDYTLEETDKQDGKIVGVTRSIVSKDGNSMTIEVSSKQRDQTMTFTAEKLP